jgi:hypothetical protein
LIHVPFSQATAGQTSTKQTTQSYKYHTEQNNNENKNSKIHVGANNEVGYSVSILECGFFLLFQSICTAEQQTKKTCNDMVS